LELKSYQKEGVEFMLRVMHDEKYRGGVLCDDMGLGKTGTINKNESLHFFAF
jgi:SNF2 family DNA or RNA helicase